MGRPFKLDLFDLILVAFAVVALVSFIRFLFSSAIRHIRVSRFFARHRPTVGILDQYEKVDADTDVTMHPVFAEKSMRLVPRTSYTPDQYFVRLKCRCGDTRFYATYRISAEDYEQERTGASVQIESHWRPIGYEVL